MVERFKQLAGALLIAFALALPLATLPNVAYAQNQSTTIVDLPRVAEWIVKIWDEFLKDALIQSVATILINTMTYAADRLAYDAAVYIASGGDGEDPLFDNRSIGDYFSEYGAAVAGEALSQIDESGLLGNFKLCDPDVEITIAFKFGLKSAFDREEPGCDVKEVVANWDGFIADIASSGATGEQKSARILTKLSDIYNPTTNDFSVGIQLYTNVLTQAQQQQFLEAQKHLLLSGFKDKTDFLTGKIDTPGELLRDNLKENLKEPEETRQEVGTVILGSSDEILLQMGLHAGSVFANTLISKGMERLYSGLFGNLDEVEIDPFSEISYSSSSAESARDSFKTFLAAAPLEITNYSILGEFGACPSVGRGLYNCVADTSLISAVARADSGRSLTVAEAIEEGLLHADWPLIPSEDTARNQDPYCYSSGYCHGNLVKLRKARIISVGWELAAESQYNDANSPVTLGEVIEGFDNCPANGQPDENHEWCHLIDPDWVLKYPDTQCRAQVYGQLLKAPSTDQRAEECVDMPSCIAEDDDGTCVGGYGYCVREENVWRFRGEDCPDYYATCTAYENSEGEDAEFLTNTVEAGECGEDSAGCLWYSTVQEDDGEGFDWPDYSTSTLFAAAEAADDAYRQRIYFTSAVEECDVDDAGCRELVTRDDDLSLNALFNPGFEDDEDADGMPDGWLSTDASVVTYSDDTSVSLSGSGAVNPSSSFVYQAGVVVTQGSSYTLSYYAAQTESGGGSTGALIALESSDGTSLDFAGIEIDGDCAVSVFGDNILAFSTSPSSTDYERFSCTFSVPTIADSAAEITAYVDVSGDLWFDNVQLEQASEASDWHEGYSDSTLDLAYYKVPPSYLGCTGEDGEPEECDDYAAVCEEQDVGCSEYTPVNGDPAVIGVANALDECPESCVGYDTFKQEATLYEPSGEFPVYFIPDTATECSEAEVGCDEFTNETTEEIEYFTYLRACLTEDQAAANVSGDNSAVFYTWEGSDLDGYQLQTWTLLESDLDASSYSYAESGETDPDVGSAPCTNWVATDAGIECDDDGDGDSSVDGDPISDNGDCDEHDDVFTNPDCREFYDAEGQIHYREWSTTVTVSDECVTYRKTEIVGDDATEQEATCEDSGGYYDSASGVCRYYGYALESETCDETASGCREYTGGRSRNSRQAFVEYFEDSTLENWNADSATNVTLSNESVATDGHSVESVGETIWTHLARESSACATEDGCTTTTGTLGGECSVTYGETTCGTLDGELFSGKTYTLSFWAKGTGTIGVGFDIGADPSSGITSSTIDEYFDEAIALETGWNEYTLGPLDIEDEDFGDGTVLVFIPQSSSVTYYVDNVVLREGEDNITIIKDSWVTPAECDETPEGTDSDQYYLGCAEYTDHNGDTAYLKSFSSLCSEDQVGCESFFMTFESDATSAETIAAVCTNDPDGDGTADLVDEATECYWGSDGSAFDTTSKYLCTIGVSQSECEFDMDGYVPLSAGDFPAHITYNASTTIVPADREAYLVVSDDVSCTSDVAGCTEVGLPTFSQDHSAVDSFTSTYLLNDPDSYDDILCTVDELFCDAWTAQDGTIDYFKNPQDQTCEYKTSVTIDGATYDGWFKTGTDELCYEDYVVGGDFGGIWRNGDDEYDNWVGTCEAKYDTCSEFQDLTDLESDEIYGDSDGEAYYYLNNESLDESSLPESQKCNDQVSQKDGCALFNDANEANKTANTSASYMLSIHADDLLGQAPNSLVDPVDCEADSADTTFAGVDLCQYRCAYTAGEYYDLSDPSSTDVLYDGACVEDADCRPLLSELGETIEGSCGDAGSANRLENDANTVVKVNRDRECAEWLSCADSQTSWDERTNSFKTICSDVELCTEYSESGSTSFCSDWKFDDVETVLDEDKYTTRDVSWYGNEYSGYAVPGIFPVQTLTQVNISPPTGACNTAQNEDATIAATHGDECDTDADCGVDLDADGDGVVTDDEVTNVYCPQGDEQDFRLVYNAGSCDEAYGESCTVGYCADSGAACASSDDCNSGVECLVGSCVELDEASSCQTDSDCESPYTTCYSSGICGYEADTLEVDEAATDCDLVSYDVASSQGSCIRGSCVLTAEGDTFDTDNAEEMVCRAYPEINSPFPTTVVEEWNDVDESDSDDPTYGSMPWEWVNTFDRVQLCVNGEDCECSYKKVLYGQGEAMKYFNLDTEFPIEDAAVGVCVGGTNNGEFCSADSTYWSNSGGSDWRYAVISAEITCADGGGTCTYPTSGDSMLGLEGYCLERDSSVNILGDRENNACITWLPVDQLSGSTDLYAKYTSAGYTGGETEYCSFIQSYVNLPSSKIDEGNFTSADASEESGFGIGCIEFASTGDDGSANDYNTDGYEGCVSENPEWRCPMGYYALVGRPDNDDDDGDDHYANVCDTSGADTDCPLMCVPIGAGTTEDGGTCAPPSGWTEATQTALARYGSSGTEIYYEIPVYYTNEYGTFDSAAEARSDCWARGRDIFSVTHDLLSDSATCGNTGGSGTYLVNGNAVSAPSGTSSYDSLRSTYSMNNAELPQDCWTDIGEPVPTAGWYNLEFSPSYYLGCSDLVQTEDQGFSGDEGAPWTDRLLNENGVFAFSTDDSQASSVDYGSQVDASKFVYTNETLSWPFGAATDSASAVESDVRPPSVPVCSAEYIDSSTNDYYKTFTSPILGEDGTSMSCESGYEFNTYAGDGDKEPEARAFVDYYGSVYYGGNANGGSYYADDSTTDVGFFSISETGQGEVAGYESPITGLLDQIFAVRVNTSSFDDGYNGNEDDVDSIGYGAFTDLGNDDNLRQYWDVRVENGVAPMVYAVDTSNCDGDYCGEDQDNVMTINGQNAGDIDATDFLRAYMKFYAAAYKEQLPIRRVIVDWQDNTDQIGSTAQNNFYKNHRGLREDTEISICETETSDTDFYEWGMNSDSCDPYYFSYSHVYSCDAEILRQAPDCTDSDADGKLDVSPCQNGGETCSFQPRIHIRDNWGFCTGTCDSENTTSVNTDETENCIDNDGSMSDSDANDECNYEEYPEDDSDTDPWVYYDGIITVTP